MFDKLADELLDLTIRERGTEGAGHALVAVPICCSIVLCCSCCKPADRE